MLSGTHSWSSSAVNPYLFIHVYVLAMCACTCDREWMHVCAHCRTHVAIRGQLQMSVLAFQLDTESLIFLLCIATFTGPQTLGIFWSLPSILLLEVWDYKHQTFTFVLYPPSHLPAEFCILSMLSHSFGYVLKIRLIVWWWLFVCYCLLVCLVVAVVFEKDLI